MECSNIYSYCNRIHSVAFTQPVIFPNKLRLKCISSPHRKWRWVISNSATLPDQFRRLCEVVGNEEDEKRRLLKIVDLGGNLPMIRDDLLTANSRVPGCTSVTHLAIHRQNDGTIRLRGYSDAVIARGLLALVVLGLDGIHEDVVQNITASDILQTCRLSGSTRASRHAGVPAILEALQTKLRKSLTTNDNCAPNQAGNKLDGRWSERQGDDVAVLLSGGVDSSVAMRMAQETGARVQAFYLKVWLDDETAHLGDCPWEEDMRYARAVCKQAGVVLHDVPFQRSYWDEVVAYTVAEARRGRTPNPDVMCNSRIKFGAFYHAFGADFKRVVTGHYAKRTICDQTGLAELRLSADRSKDQTYFLSHLKQEQIAKADFPLGGLTKRDVRQLAENYELANCQRKDSQGICFLGKLRFDEFLAHHLGEQRGSLVEFESGHEVGVHKGFWFFTVGQRRGIGLSGGPWHVIAKDINRNIVYVSRQYDNVDEERRSFNFDSPVWISGEWPHGLRAVGATQILRVKTRHGPTMHNVVITRTGDNEGHVQLQSRDKGLAAGQFAAFYDSEERCLGSGVIAYEPLLLRAPDVIVPMNRHSKKLQAHL